MQKKYLFSLQIGMPQANALKSIIYGIHGYSTVSDESLGKSATVFIRVTKNYRNWLPAYLIFSAIDIQRLYIYRISNSREEYCIRISC